MRWRSSRRAVDAGLRQLSGSRASRSVASSRCAPAVTVAQPPARLVTVAPALDRYFGPDSPVPLPPCPWALIQGDADEVIDPAAVLGLAAAVRPVPRTVVLPGVGHFFHGRLPALRDAVLSAVEASA